MDIYYISDSKLNTNRLYCGLSSLSQFVIPKFIGRGQITTSPLANSIKFLVIVSVRMICDVLKLEIGLAAGHIFIAKIESPSIARKAYGF